jgi:hypothetical protein
LLDFGESKRTGRRRRIALAIVYSTILYRRSCGKETCSIPRGKAYIRPLVSFTNISVSQSCVDGSLRLFPPSSGKPDICDSHGDHGVQHDHLEPIDVLVDIIIGYLEKGTAFLRAVGNRSFASLSGVVRESTVNLILTVGVS